MKPPPQSTPANGLFLPFSPSLRRRRRSSQELPPGGAGQPVCGAVPRSSTAGWSMARPPPSPSYSASSASSASAAASSRPPRSSFVRNFLFFFPLFEIGRHVAHFVLICWERLRFHVYLVVSDWYGSRNWFLCCTLFCAEL